MKKFGILSDTHVHSLFPHYIKTIEKIFLGVDMILHCGDIISEAVIEELSLIAPVKAVCGNMDPYDLKSILPQTYIFKEEDIKIGMTHGSGSPIGIEERIKKLFPEDIDLIIYGHTHYPMNRYIKNTLFFNPGSITDKRHAPYNSAGVITINGQSIKGEILKV